MLQQGTRTTSLARSIVWSAWWRRLLSYMLIDLVVCAVIVGCFAASSSQRARTEGLPQGRIAWHKALNPVDHVVYDITLENTEHITYRLSEYVEGFWPVLAVIVAGEIVSLVALPFSTRRVRRKLQPLNELALAAEELGNSASTDMHKIQNLEQAIHSATVDSPHVSTGDKDLRSIEVALNGLLKQMQDAKLQQMRFVSDASHELRTPISVIQGYVNMLDRWGKTDEAVLDESIEALKAESAHMQKLVEQLLFLARGDSGRNVLQQEYFDLEKTLHEVWEESRMIDASHTYTFNIAESDTQNSTYCMVGDASMVKQLARILIQNAVAYAPEGTEITLSVGSNNTGLFFSVQDEGIGMSKEDASHIFERFYRADNARDRTEGGTGLGLSIAAWIVEAHNGTIEVLSYEGVGTRFTVQFDA